jgi:hypothetical protein
LKGHSTDDNHHPAGAANSPATIPIPVNDHRAVLSNAQYSWPTKTLQNRSGDPHLQMAASIRGYIDTRRHFIDEESREIDEEVRLIDRRRRRVQKERDLLEKILQPLPEMLEKAKRKQTTNGNAKGRNGNLR